MPEKRGEHRISGEHRIKRVVRFDKSAFLDLNKLLFQLSLSGYQMTESRLKKVVKEKNSYLFAVYDGNHIIGTATLVEMFLIREHKGYIENVVVDENYRSRGLGRRLVSKLIDTAKSLGVERLEMKSEPHRIVANALYKKMGFQHKESNVYIMPLR